MPSTSEAQHNFMEMCAHDPQHTHGKCPSAEVAKEFAKADEADESGVITELDIAKKIISGELSSPQMFHNMMLIDLRITGTGAAYRADLGEFVYRPPEEYLNDEFLERCNGLPVIWIHPEGDMLDSSEFSKRVIGNIFIPHIESDEVMGIAKIYDEGAIKSMLHSQLSTSPGVLFDLSSKNKEVKLESGKHLLIEGKPCLLDHLAICEQGIWDKLGTPTGVRVDDESGGGDMAGFRADSEKKAEEIKADGANKDAEGNYYPRGDSDGMKSILDALGSISTRLDAVDKRFDLLEKAKEAVESEGVEKKDEKAALDADEMKRRLDAMESAIKGDDDETEYAAMADVQARADSVMQLHGKQASRPLRGEKLAAYRQRLIKPLQEFSEALKAVDLSKIGDMVAFSHMEKQIYADAVAFANDPKRMMANLPRGKLRAVEKKMGRVDCTEFVGDISGFTGKFKMPAFKVAFNKNGTN